MVIEFVETWRTETSRVGGPETEIPRGVHQRGLGGQVVVEGLVMGEAQSDSGSEILEEFLFVLGVCCQGMDTLVDIARGGCQIVLAPVGTKDGSGLVIET